MKVGDRIQVVQLNKKESSSFPLEAEGCQRALQIKHEVGFDVVGFNVYFLKNEIKPICTMVITKIK